MTARPGLDVPVLVVLREMALPLFVIDATLAVVVSPFILSINIYFHNIFCLVPSKIESSTGLSSKKLSFISEPSISCLQIISLE